MSRLIRAALIVAVATFGLALPAHADGTPTVVSSVSPDPVVLFATTDATVTVTANVAPSDPSVPIATVTADLTATTPSGSAGEVDEIPVQLSTADGVTWQGSATIPRTAGYGAWLASVTATDTAAVTATSQNTFSVKRNTITSLSFSPSDPRATGTVTANGLLRRMVPGSDPSINGTYIPYTGKSVTLNGPDGLKTFTTDTKGQFHYTTTVLTTATWTAAFAGTPYHQASSATVTLPVVRNATRFYGFDASPEPAYRHAYLTISGQLQANDPNGDAWLSYANKQVTIYRDSPSTYQTTATTDSKGHFSVVVHGVSSTVDGTWHAAFAGTIYHAPSVSSGDTVLTATAPMRITRVYYNSPGSDDRSNKSLNAEYVTLTNEGSHYANLYDWSLRDAVGHEYDVSSSVYVAPGHSVTIHTGSGTDTSTDLYWGSGDYIWNNDGDTAYLRSDLNSSVDTCSWGSSGSSTSC